MATTHWRSLFENKYLGAWDVPEGSSITLTIRRIKIETLKNETGAENKKPVLYFDEVERGMALNKTNGSTIATLYGRDAGQWIGKRITVITQMVQFAGKNVEALRVVPQKHDDVVSAQRTGAVQAPALPARPAVDLADAYRRSAETELRERIAAETGRPLEQVTLDGELVEVKR